MIPDNIRSDMIELYNKIFDYKFNKKVYRSNLEALKEEHRNLLEQIAMLCDESDDFQAEAAEYIPQYVSEQLEMIGSKRKRELAAIDHNMNMVSYFVPLMGEIPSMKAEEFSRKIVAEWNEKMPDHKIGYSAASSVESGFKQSLCYITTAVCQSLKKPDDCYELTLLRDYRDQYMMETESRRQVVEEYYNIAPTIVKKIDRECNSNEIYEQIWETYLKPCVKLIEADNRETCAELYGEMVRQLEKRYLYS